MECVCSRMHVRACARACVCASVCARAHLCFQGPFVSLMVALKVSLMVSLREIPCTHGNVEEEESSAIKVEDACSVYLNPCIG